MKFLQVILATLAAVSIACSTASSSTPAPASATPVAAAAPTATAVIEATPAPVVIEIVVTATPTGTRAPTPSGPLFQLEFPAWVDESPQMAAFIERTPVIAEAKFLSLESTVKEMNSPALGYEAELLYKFQVIQYLKGDGADELIVSLSSGPKYNAFPDWMAHRTEEEARELAVNWLRRNPGGFGNGKGIIFLFRPFQENDYSFIGAEHGQGYGGKPIIGETWLYAGVDSLYWHKFTGGTDTAISLEALKGRIDDIRILMEGQYAECVSHSLHQRSEVRERILGTYRELTLGGYREPEPLPRYMVEIDADMSEYAKVFVLRRPPYRPPMVSDYWLDGRDKDLFAIDSEPSTIGSYESVAFVGVPAEGEYSIYYSQFHRSLPCNDEDWGGDAWWEADTAEWVVNVTTDRRD